MQKVHITASEPYDVLIGRSLLDSGGEYLAECFGIRRAAIITDTNVEPLYGARLRTSLAEAGFRVSQFVFPAGERSKNAGTYIQILEFLAREQLTRSDLLVALGGGVVGDIAGFAAATYLRGVDFVQIPTTFLAAVDSSTGGKTAIDLESGKNLAGAFHLPGLVLCDCDTFETLPETVFADGVAETLKHGLIADAAFFHLLESGGLRNRLEDVVRRNVEIKSSFVQADEWDRGCRQLLNFGHTVGHAIELCSGYTLTHGHAVAVGMVIVSRGARRLGLTECDCAGRIAGALERYGLPTGCRYGARELFEAATRDKKRTGDTINVICLREIGCAEAVRIDLPQLKELIAAGLENQEAGTWI